MSQTTHDSVLHMAHPYKEGSSCGLVANVLDSDFIVNKSKL